MTIDTPFEHNYLTNSEDAAAYHRHQRPEDNGSLSASHLWKSFGGDGNRHRDYQRPAGT